MSTTIRPELSKKNKYWLDKHRFYELKHFCLQYPLWKRIYISLDGAVRQNLQKPAVQTSAENDPTEKAVELRGYYGERMNLIERTAELADEDLKDYILRGVTHGLSYDTLQTKYEIPCSRDTYYDRYRRFFWLLDQFRA